MNKTVVALLFVFFALAAKTDTPLEQRAKGIAEDYYSSFQKLAKMPNPYNDEGRRLEDKIMKLAGADSHGNVLFSDLRVSNDIDPILGSINSGKSDVTISNYVGHYIEYAAKRDFGFSYRLVSCKQLEVPSYGSLKNDFQFATIMVRKTFAFSKECTNVDEKMVVAFSGNESFLSSLNNEFGTSQTSGDLFARALDYYDNKQYKEALDAFEDCVRIFGDIKAKYYASIMYLKRQGCKNLKRSECNEKAVRYLKDAKKGGISNAEYILVRLGVEK